jgi:hypothetical protein
MARSAQAPGLYYEALPPVTEPSPLRSDVAGFFGPTRRGPVGTLLRIEGWRQYLRWFGPLVVGAYTPYAIKGYFENGGQVAWVLRIAGPRAQTASVSWPLSADVASNGFESMQYEVTASSAGRWANGATVAMRYRRRGALGRPEVDVTVNVDGEPIEYLMGLDPARLTDLVNARSALVTMAAVGAPPPALDPAHPGPAILDSGELALAGGDDGMDLSADPDAALHRGQHRDAWLDAARVADDEPEIALVAMPDLYSDPLLQPNERDDLITEQLVRAAELHDRMLLLDAPSGHMPVVDLLALADRLRLLANDPADPTLARCGALYHPWLAVEDPLATRDPKLIEVPPSGHVAGAISRLDRERGAHHTPANAPILQAWDVSDRLDDDQPALNPAGVNLLRCMAGHGLQVWGGRTLHVDPEALEGLPSSAVIDGRMIAHRRLIHRLVRAIRRVAEPLVFDVNGPELWLTLVRAITAVLLEAFRAGALKGDRPADAFVVRCDEKTNPPEEIDLGRCVCEIQLAPAKPMEFILLKVALLANGALEVVE